MQIPLLPDETAHCVPFHDAAVRRNLHPLIYIHGLITEHAFDDERLPAMT
jgi:hypothetical protein